MKKTISGLFDSYSAAEAAVRELEAQGISHDDISIVANRSDSRAPAEGRSYAPGEHATKAGEDAGYGAEVGAAVGGVGGLLAGLGVIAIPGVGPVVAAGWLVSTLVGAVAGAAVGGAAGGLVGSLTAAGVPETEAHVYAEGVRRGGTLVTARVEDHEEAAARAVLDRNSRVDPLERDRVYRSEGWTGFSDTAEPVGRDPFGTGGSPTV